MYDAVAGKILTVGGAPSYQVRAAEGVAIINRRPLQEHKTT